MTSNSDTGRTGSTPILDQVRAMHANFWVANGIEALERLAFFGVRAVLPLYMVNATGGGLGLSYSEKGLIYGIWALIQCLVPMVSGGYTDTYGYRKSMYVAFSINILGYVIMANAGGFWTMLVSAMCVGTGTAIFKPPVQGAVAKSLTDTNSGLGFGIFYWVVNIGGFLAPMAAAWARGNELNPTWNHVFYGAAIVTAINFLPAALLFREPELDEEGKGKAPLVVFKETMAVLWKDQAMLRFLLIISGFWFMFMQLWDLLPNFIDEWVDARDVGAGITAVTGDWGQRFLDPSGAAKPEMLINIDSATILLLVLPLSWFFARFRMIYALVIGMVVATVGFVAAGLTPVGWVVAFMIFVFAIGEIICSPKFSEYIGMTAPPDKKALYMGYSNIPFAIGWAAGNWLSGPLYDALSSKVMLARRYMVEELGLDATRIEALPKEQVVDTLQQELIAAGQLSTGASIYDVNRILWDAYNPWVIWIILGMVGVISVVGIVWNYRRSLRQERAEAQVKASAGSESESAEE